MNELYTYTYTYTSQCGRTSPYNKTVTDWYGLVRIGTDWY
jgi:hypothetical protein